FDLDFDLVLDLLRLFDRLPEPDLLRDFDFDFVFDFRRGSPFRLVSANSSSCDSDIDSYIPRDAPCSFDLLVSPRLADSAAPAAFCCACDLAGMVVLLTPSVLFQTGRMPAVP